MNVYLGLFLVAFSTLSLEITLVRLLSVTTWYHLAFFAISTAMLGMTAGATRVYLQPRAFEPASLAVALWKSCLHMALSIPVTLLLLCLVPLSLTRSVMSLFALLITTLACALPYYFAGTVVSAVLTKHDLPMGRLYASDLIGASLGCLFVLGGLEVLDAPSLILLCACTSTLAAVCFAWKEPTARRRRLGAWISVAFFLVAIGNSLSSSAIRPVIVKGERVEPSNDYLLERWNSFSRVAVYPFDHSAPQYWGPSPVAPGDFIDQYRMNIDGEAGTVLRRFESREDIDHLRYDVTNVGYWLGRKGDACIIGVGGGRDLQSACLFGHERVTGIEINRIFIDLLQKRFRSFAGLADRPGVTLVTAEARSYLSLKPQKYSVIQMSLIDTWAATGAGAFSLSENALYTVEAWELFLSRLEPDGIFTVSRWRNPRNVGEVGRLVSLAVASLQGLGVPDPSAHLALITTDNVSTLLICRRPFTPEDVARLSETCRELRFEALYLPGQIPTDPVLRGIIASRTPDQLSKAIAGAVLNCRPPTDESPYFFNMLRLGNLRAAFVQHPGVVRGNLIATVTLAGLLLMLIVVSVATIILPLALRSRFPVSGAAPSRTLWPAVLYFALIGCGFMLTEIALIQRLTVFLTHPLYALGILLFTLIASTGVGSLVSDRLPLTRSPWRYVYPALTAGCLVGLSFLMNSLLRTMVTAPIGVRIATSVAVIFPMGFLMGLFFPTGMSLAKSVSSGETPWYWALNGVFGVLCSALAVLVSIYIGVSVNFYLAALCYASVVIAQVGLHRARGATLTVL